MCKGTVVPTDSAKLMMFFLIGTGFECVGIVGLAVSRR